jgi:hypothetical protein
VPSILTIIALRYLEVENNAWLDSFSAKMENVDTTLNILISSRLLILIFAASICFSGFVPIDLPFLRFRSLQENNTDEK